MLGSGQTRSQHLHKKEDCHLKYCLAFGGSLPYSEGFLLRISDQPECFLRKLNDGKLYTPFNRFFCCLKVQGRASHAEFFLRAASPCGQRRAGCPADDPNAGDIVLCLGGIAIRAGGDFNGPIPLGAITEGNIRIRHRRKRITHGSKMSRITPAV